MATDESSSDSTSQRPAWIVGFDGSDHAKAALEWAAPNAAAHAADLRVVAAWQFSYFGEVPLPGGAIPADSIESQDRIAEEIEATAKDIAEAAGVGMTPIVVAGSAAEVILSSLEDAELAVVGTRGRGGFGRLLLGSVSHQLAVHSPRPTIIVPSDYASSELRRIVIGADGSTNSEAALRWIHAFAPLDAELVAVHGYEAAPNVMSGLGPDTYQLLSDAAEKEFNDSVDAIEQEVGDPNRFTRIFELGHAGRSILEHGEDADLVVVGARGRSGVLGTVLGSVSTWVIHHLSCPAAVIPES